MRKNIKYYLLAMPLLVTFLVLQAEASEVFNATGPIFSEPVRAKLRSKKETVLSSGIGAKIAKLTYREGDSFKSGAVLVKFDCSMEEAEMQYAKAEKKAAETAVRVNKQLDKLKSISLLDVEKSVAELDMARAKVGIMRAKLKTCIEKAPFNGRIANLNVKPYQRVNPGEVLMSIVDPDSLEVELRVPSSWLRWLKREQKFRLHIEEVDKEFEAVVSSIGAKVDPVSQTVKIIGELNAKDGSVLPGMSGNAVFSFNMQKTQ